VRIGGSPRTWLAIVGVILIAFVFGAGKSSALLGLLLIIGVAMIVVSAAWSLRARRRRRET